MTLELELDIDLFFDHFGDIERIYFKKFKKSTKRKILRILIEIVENVRKYGSERNKYSYVKIYQQKGKTIINSGNFMNADNSERINEIFSGVKGLDKFEVLKRYNERLFDGKVSVDSNKLGVLRIIALSDEFYYSVDPSEDDDELYLTLSAILN